MANDLNQNPWALDTPTTFSLCPGLHLRIAHIRWVGGTTAGHQAILNDDDSNLVWRGIAAGANHVESDIHNPRPKGLYASALQSGVLYVQYE